MARERLPLRQLQLNAAVAVAGFGRFSGRVERLELAEAAATRRCAGTPFSMRNFTKKKTDVERAVDSSQLSRKRPVPDSGMLSVWPSTRSTQFDLGRNLALQFEDGFGQPAHLFLPSGVDLLGARGKKHFRLEHETVADDADAFAVRQDLAAAGRRRVGAVAVQLLDTLGERHV